MGGMEDMDGVLHIDRSGGGRYGWCRGCGWGWGYGIVFKMGKGLGLEIGVGGGGSTIPLNYGLLFYKPNSSFRSALI